MVSIVSLFTAITLNPETGEEARRVYGKLSNGKELRVLHTIDELNEADKPLRLVIGNGEYGDFIRLSNKKEVEKLEFQIEA
jgi:hypothetical protein